ncbi:ParA family protein [Guyparkeria hydrothermalis]|uniref:ParA family protein n=1 Tax=Guyparkeria hydrothermalis TaxID=923 RepID=UPI00201FD0CD|nr:ParA family protein [Guyparkeria hydrothermalis]MCL7744847.1 ParA family protein [Guyparkeria hydrothermalis]
MAQTVALYSVKGGVGKTASTVNLAALSAAAGRRVLVWDLDPQRAASWYLQAEPSAERPVKKLLKPKGIAKAVRPTIHNHLWVLPALPGQQAIEHHLADKKDAGYRLAKLLDPLTDQFEEIWIDAPPGLSLLADNVLRAADMVLVPMVPTHLSERTWYQLKQHLDERKIHPEHLRTYLALVDRRRRMHREFRERHRHDIPELLETEIPYASVVERMGEDQQPSVYREPRHPANQAYRALWEEIDALFA